MCMPPFLLNDWSVCLPYNDYFLHKIETYVLTDEKDCISIGWYVYIKRPCPNLM